MLNNIELQFFFWDEGSSKIGFLRQLDEISTLHFPTKSSLTHSPDYATVQIQLLQGHDQRSLV